MESGAHSRRDVLKGGAAGLAGLSLVQVAGPARAFTAVPSSAGRAAASPVVVPWLDVPPPVPEALRSAVGPQLQWEQIARYTPNAEFFTVRHYNLPDLDPSTWRLSVGGSVRRPLVLSLAALKALPRTEVAFTLECSGDHGLAFATGVIGNARWSGVALRRVLRRADPLDKAREVVFWGADRGTVTVRDDSGVLSAGRTGTGTSDASGGLDLTITERYARSMSLDDAMAADVLLCDTMNGAPLPREHGRPVRLIAPGWYGVANVKWLTRVELIDSHYAGRFMARDYVTVREEGRRGDTVWTFTTVGPARLKSAPARVTRTGTRYEVLGAAWGAPIGRVEVQVDEGPWRAAHLQRRLTSGADPDGREWRFWTYDWGTPAAGEHIVRSRAFDRRGAVQPMADDPFLTSRRTYWEANGQITRRVRTT